MVENLIIVRGMTLETTVLVIQALMSSYGGLSYASDADDDLSISSRYNEGYQSGGDEGDNSEKSENVQSVQKIPIIDVYKMKNTYLTLMHILKELTHTHFNEIYNAYRGKIKIDTSVTSTVGNTKEIILNKMAEHIKSKLNDKKDGPLNQFTDEDEAKYSITEYFYSSLKNLKKLDKNESIPLQTLQTLIAKYALFYLLFYIYKTETETEKTTNKDENYQQLESFLNNEYTIDLSYNTGDDDVVINYSEKENPDSKLTNSLMKTHNDFMSDKPDDGETNPFFTLDILFPKLS